MHFDSAQVPSAQLCVNCLLLQDERGIASHSSKTGWHSFVVRRQAEKHHWRPQHTTCHTASAVGRHK